MKRNIDINEVSDGKLYSSNDLVKVECNDCRGCSDCCRGMGNSIVLDPYDIFRLCNGLKLRFEQLLVSGIELNVVDGIILPNLKMDSESNCCHFLNDEGRCSIHTYRPGICRMFPLGRIYNEDSFKYFLQIYECSSKNQTKVKVKKWIDTPNINQYEKYINDWHGLLMKLQKMIHDSCLSNENNKSADDNKNLEFSKKISMSVLNNFYLKEYNMDVDFYEQFYDRLKEFE